MLQEYKVLQSVTIITYQVHLVLLAGGTVGAERTVYQRKVVRLRFLSTKREHSVNTSVVF